jgi:hypothetical protein
MVLPGMVYQVHAIIGSIVLLVADNDTAVFCGFFPDDDSSTGFHYRSPPKKHAERYYGKTKFVYPG